MKFRPYVLLALVATAGLVAACGEDIAGAGEPFEIVTDRSQAVVTEGVSFAITAFTIDQNNRRVPGALSASVAAGSVALDSTVYVQELTETRFFLRGTGPTDGTDVTITGHNLTKTAVILVE